MTLRYYGKNVTFSKILFKTLSVYQNYIFLKIYKLKYIYREEREIWVREPFRLELPVYLKCQRLIYCQMKVLNWNIFMSGNLELDQYFDK